MLDAERTFALTLVSVFSSAKLIIATSLFNEVLMAYNISIREALIVITTSSPCLFNKGKLNSN